MTVHNNFSTHHLAALSPTPPATRPAASSVSAAAPAEQARESAEPSTPLPSLPSGMLGHNVDTTA
jgi:hypothetical protein